MKSALLLFVFACPAAFAQEEWANYPIDRNVETLFPAVPETETTFDYHRAVLDVDDVRMIMYSFVYGGGYNDRVSNIDELKKFYSWQLNNEIRGADGIPLDSSFVMQRDILIATTRYTIPGGICECQALFVKKTFYEFNICGAEKDEVFDELARNYFRSITINNDLTPEDQMLSDDTSPNGLSASTNDLLTTLGLVVGNVSLGIFFIWFALLIVIFVGKRSNKPSPLFVIRLFAIVRWVVVVLFLALTLLLLITFVSNAAALNRRYYYFLLIALILLTIGIAALRLKAPSPPSNPT
jgi:hypothetical protein